MLTEQIYIYNCTRQWKPYRSPLFLLVIQPKSTFNAPCYTGITSGFKAFKITSKSTTKIIRWNQNNQIQWKQWNEQHQPNRKKNLNRNLKNFRQEQGYNIKFQRASKLFKFIIFSLTFLRFKIPSHYQAFYAIHIRYSILKIKISSKLYQHWGYINVTSLLQSNQNKKNIKWIP